MFNPLKKGKIQRKKALDNYVDKQVEQIEKESDKQLHSSILHGHKGIWRDFIKLLFSARLPWLLVVISIVVSLISTKVGSLFPAYQQKLTSGQFDSIVIRNAILILLASFVLGRINTFLGGYTNANISLAMRNKVYSHCLSLPLKAFQKIAPRELISRITQDADALSSTLTTILLIFVSNVYGSYLYIKNAYMMSARLTNLFLVLCPIYIVLKLIIGRINFNLQFRARYRFAYLTRYMASILMNVPVVKAFVKEDYEDKRGEGAISSFTKMQFALEATGVSFDLIDQIFDGVNNLIYILYGAYLIRIGMLDFGSWFGFYLYSMGLYTSILIILNLWPMLKSSQGSILRIQEIVKIPEENFSENVNLDKDVNLAKDINLLQSKKSDTAISSASVKSSEDELTRELNSIKLENLTFAYDDLPVLQDINLEFNSNERIAIVGPSGSGKSTLLLLLDRFFAADSGKISFNNRDAETCSLYEWRNNFAYLQQEVILLGKSIRENLTYGLKKNYSDDDLYQSLRKVGLEDLVKRLDKKLDTVINDGQLNLSGGETQRLAIARLLLKDTKFVLLDEATSNLDALNEARVYSAIDELSKNKGIIMVTHKIKRANKFDKVAVIENGRLIAFDSPANLLDTCPLYKKLYDAEIHKGGQK